MLTPPCRFYKMLDAYYDFQMKNLPKYFVQLGSVCFF